MYCSTSLVGAPSRLSFRSLVGRKDRADQSPNLLGEPARRGLDVVAGPWSDHRGIRDAEPPRAREHAARRPRLVATDDGDGEEGNVERARQAKGPGPEAAEAAVEAPPTFRKDHDGLFRLKQPRGL